MSRSAFETFDRALQIGAGSGLEKRLEVRRAVDRGSRQESGQDLLPPAAERGLVDPGVLGPDLRFVLREALRGRAEDREVDIDQQGRIRRFGTRGMPRRHHQVVHPERGIGCDAGGEQFVAGPGGASGLVVVATDVVDGIVEPERQLDLAGRLRQVANRLEMSEAFSEMLQRVIAALRLAVGFQEALQQGLLCLKRAEVAPGALPRPLQHGHLAGHGASGRSRVTSAR